MRETIHIYHTNDLHSHFEHWSRIRDFLKMRKQWHLDEGEPVYLFDIGDHVDRWHPLSEATLGKGNVDFLNEVGFDAVTIGNNEGITLDYEDLNSLYEDADFHVIVGNLFDRSSQLPSWVKTHHIYQTNSGMKIGVIGLTAYFKPFYKALGWNITSPVEELEKLVQELHPQVDMVILLSHLGIRDDELIAERFPGVDVILGAHTHHVLHQGKEIKGTMLGAAGKYGHYVGHMMIEVDTANKKIVGKKAQLYEQQELPFVEKEEQENLEWYREGEELLGEEVTELAKPLPVDWFNPSTLPNVLCDALAEWCEADCAFLNSGLLIDGLSEGTVTKQDLHRILPHPINPCLIEMKGAELKEIIKQTFNEEWPHLQVKGLGFRGKVMGRFVYTNIQFKGHEILIDHNPIDPQKIYKLALPDMFTFGHFFPDLQRLGKKYFMPEFLRDILQWKLKQ
ncbi:bifunctional UDP-sugar hydrolase/5'-nucleotidase [Rossellomorea aquimaris]|uniref:2',3'-cyclic-nucleotide 2'-phosphodiesterase (5'-nucleotidase family) n=1 Tax=Rossellomorea aquimaris TaxID=189382 RepID=A0A366EVC7_9BACI|nr:bifunctional UDP-sugar hydrolase/5'-nucleotidase [Rossellomorea aquimaris]RBP05445.1 2',3'-cyclic-nucleotide 2'-phosphodiesterase (5'-nucleotidase family) [Rossellomorea aquimaris]